MIINKSSEKAVLLCWNVWSVLNPTKLQNFLNNIEDAKVDLACVCETWFDSKNGNFSKMIRDAGYKLHHAYREEKRAGGVAIMYKEKLTVKEEDASTSQYTSFEYACVTLTLQLQRRIVLVCLYRNQEVSFTLFHDELSLFLDKMIFKGDVALIVGDFNVWVEMEEEANANKLQTLMNAYGLSQHVREPTHRNGHTLDQIYFNECQADFKHEVWNDTMGLTTDHFPLCIDLPSCNITHNTRTIHFRKLKEVDMNEFRSDLEDAFGSMEFRENETFEMLATQYHSLSLSVVDKHSPVVVKKCQPSTAPWIDTEYKRNRAMRRKYEREWKNNRTEENRTKYIDQKKVCSDLALSKQTDHYSKIIHDAGNCQKSLFRVANELMDKTKEKVLPFHSDPKKLANEFNEYFVDKVKKIRNSIPVENEPSSHYSRPFQGERMNTFRTVTEDEVELIIREHGIKTSMEDPIPSKLMQPSLDVVLPTLTKLINQSLMEGSMNGIKESVLDPLLKKSGLDIDEMKNFRPVNNLLFLSKLIERVAGDQLDQHMEVNCLQESSQFAYKRHHNTETMMLGVTDEVLRGFDENQATVIIFLDLSAAFDTIDVGKLLEILYNEIGVGGVVLEWFRSFLEGRSQRVKIGNEYSESLEVPCGAPQGSVLGPKIFNINVRSQPLVFKKCMFSSSSFADDSNGRKQFALTFQFNVLQNDIVHCLRQIITWSNSHFMKINPDKTEILLLCPSSLNKEVIIKGVIFDGQCIRFSSEVKNVGVYLDQNLNLNKHVNHIVSHTFKILKDVGRVRKCLQRNHIEKVLHAVISSRLDYCNSLFMNMSKQNLYKLQKVQNAAARLILGKRRRDSATLALKELHWLNVDARITFKILLIVFKILHGNCSDLGLQYKSFNGRPNDYLLLETPNFKTAYGKRIFAYNGSRLWNTLPVHVRAEEDIERFKKSIKTILFEGNTDFKKKAYKYNQ